MKNCERVAGLKGSEANNVNTYEEDGDTDDDDIEAYGVF